MSSQEPPVDEKRMFEWMINEVIPSMPKSKAALKNFLTKVLRAIREEAGVAPMTTAVEEKTIEAFITACTREYSNRDATASKSSETPQKEKLSKDANVTGTPAKQRSATSFLTPTANYARARAAEAATPSIPNTPTPAQRTPVSSRMGSGITLFDEHKNAIVEQTAASTPKPQTTIAAKKAAAGSEKKGATTTADVAFPGRPLKRKEPSDDEARQLSDQAIKSLKLDKAKAESIAANEGDGKEKDEYDEIFFS